MNLDEVSYLVCLQVRQQMEKQVAQKSTELEQYLQRVRELEDMYRQLEDALEDERRARQDEETVRKLQARSVNKKGFPHAQILNSLVILAIIVKYQYKCAA